MSAMNGAAASVRRALGGGMALALLASAVFASGASAHKASGTPTAYVAFGDSISFGYKEETFDINQVVNKTACEKFEQSACEPASSFEPGFVGDFGKKLASEEKGKGDALTTFNLGCPGETSGGLIGNGPLGSAIEAERTAKDEASLHLSAPCGYHNVDGFPLKTELGSGVSELEYAVGLLESGVDVKAVTINIGSNDELASVAQCKNPAYDAEQGFTSFTQCLVTEAGPGGHEYPGGLFNHIITNMGVTIGTLRAYGYTGPVVLLGFYNPDAIILSGSDALQQELNGALEAAVGAKELGEGVSVANPFPYFNYKKNSAHEAEHLQKYTEIYNENDKKVNLEKLVGHSVSAEEASKYPEGDIHPTAAGYAKIAQLVNKAFGI